MKQEKLNTFLIHVQDRPGALDRIIGLFRRRLLRVNSLTMGPCERTGILRMTLVVDCDRRTAGLVEASLDKLIDVHEIVNLNKLPGVARYHALIKVRCDLLTRERILEVCRVFRAGIVDFSLDTAVVEITGTAEKVEGLIEILEPFGLAEIARSGQIGMTRGSKTSSAEVPWMVAQAASQPTGRPAAARA